VEKPAEVLGRPDHLRADPLVLGRRERLERGYDQVKADLAVNFGLTDLSQYEQLSKSDQAAAY